MNVSTEPPVLVRVEGKAGRLTLNRPKVIHALTLEMCEIMLEALLAWRDDPAIELVVVDHLPGSRGFCAGGDIKAIAKGGKGNGDAAAYFFAVEYSLNALIFEYPKPYVALMDGFAMGGGEGLCILGSHRIGTEESVLAMPEGTIGLFPDVGGGWFLPRLRGELGMWMALTGARVSGLDCLASDIATHFTPAAQLDALKQALGEQGISALEGLRQDAPLSFQDDLARIDQHFALDSVEAIIESLHADGSDWALAQVRAMSDKCPMTLKVAHRQLRLGRQATDFRAWMATEYRIGNRMCRRDDFREGVRALLIDKDKNPRWSPAQLSDISDSDVDAVFAPLGDVRPEWHPIYA